MSTLTPSSFVTSAAQVADGIRRIHRALTAQIERALANLAEHRRQRRGWIGSRDELGALDAATLRDLGLHRSETDSVAAELHGIARATRQRVLDARADTRSM